MLVTIDVAFGSVWLYCESWPAALIVFGIILSYVFGHAIAHLSSVVLERWFLRKVLRSPEEHLLAIDAWQRRRDLVFPGNFEPLPLETQVRILARAEAENAGVDPRARFLHCRTLVTREEATLKPLDIFLNLYGFARNLCMAAIISALVLFASIPWGPERLLSVHQRRILGGLCLVAAYFLLLRYLKFFREYVSEVFTEYAEPAR